MTVRLIRFISILFILFSVTNSAIAKEIQLWHSMDGQLGILFQNFVERFNQKVEYRDKDIKIVPKFKGTYEQTMDAGLKALHTKDAPHILQVYEMGNLV